MERSHLEAICGQPVVSAGPVGGGCINQAFRVITADGTVLFVKTAADGPAGMYDAEAHGLRWLAEAGAPVPEVVAVREEPPRGLALEWIEPGPVGSSADEQLGRDLADLHRFGAPCFGLERDNFIGSLTQPNGPADTWARFHAERRLLPFARQAADRGALSSGGLDAVERLADRLDSVAGPPEPPARLHGDLWSGNVVAGSDGRIRLIDPAVHGGHREVDLAMMRLFGGFTGRTFATYLEAFPLADGWEERVTLWQLHPLLVHAVLFGGGYGARAEAVARRYA